MNENKQRKTDWIYLPNSLEEVSLWECLHDGELITCKSDVLDRVVSLEFSVKHLLNGNDKSTTFFVHLDEVTSVRAIAHFRWPGNFEEPANISREELELLVKDYQDKWREESLSWHEFESALATDPLQIVDAGFVSSNDLTTLRLGGFLNGEKFDDIYIDVFLRGNRLWALRGDGQDCSLQGFIDLGMKYWKDFGEQS